MITIRLTEGHIDAQGRREIKLDSAKYMWNVDEDGDLQILVRDNPKEYVGLFVQGSWWSVVDLEEAAPAAITFPTSTNITYNPTSTASMTSHTMLIPGTTGPMIYPT